MVLLVLMFLSILLASFGLVVALTRPSQQETTIDQRMALIHLRGKNRAAAIMETEQLLKAIDSGPFARLNALLEPYRFARNLQRRILQASSSTTVATLLAASLGLCLGGYAISWLFA